MTPEGLEYHPLLGTFNLTINRHNDFELHPLFCLYRLCSGIESIIYNCERGRDRTCNQWLHNKSVYGLVQCLLCLPSQVNRDSNCLPSP